MTIAFTQVAVIGAGAMGRGIAQIAAQAGSQVWLYDTQAEAIQKAKVAVHQVGHTGQQRPAGCRHRQRLQIPFAWCQCLE